MYPPLGSEIRGGLREQAPIVSPVVTPHPPVETSNGIPTLAVEDSHLSSRLGSQEHAGTSHLEVRDPGTAADRDVASVNHSDEQRVTGPRFNGKLPATAIDFD